MIPWSQFASLVLQAIRTVSMLLMIATQLSVTTYQNNTFTPPTSPLTTDKCYPITLTPNTFTNRHLRVHLNAHAEVQFQGRRGDLQGTRHVAFGESMKKVVCGDGVFHNTEVGGAFQ